MTANVFSVMDALVPPNPVATDDAGSPGFRNPHRFFQFVDEGAIGGLDQSGREWHEQYESLNFGERMIEHQMDLVGVLRGIEQELYWMGVDDNASPVHFPPDSTNYKDFTLDTTGNNKNNLFRFMQEEGGASNALWDVDPNGNEALATSELYIVANTYAQLYHNVVSFLAFTDLLSGHWIKPDEQFPGATYPGPGDNVPDGYDNYTPSHISVIHPMISNSISHFTQFAIMASHFETANGDAGTDKMFASINATAQYLISNTIHVASPMGDPRFRALDPPNLRMHLSRAPYINSFVMWAYTANGMGEYTTGTADRPGNLLIDLRADGTHPAEDMSPNDVYVEWRDKANSWCFMLRGYIDDTLKDPNYDWTPGVRGANTYYFEMAEWVDRWTKAMTIANLNAAEKEAPVEKSTALTAALANTA